MSRINLLPWREERRKQEQIEFFVILGVAAAITLLIWGVIHMHYSARVDYQSSRNQFLESQISRLDKKIEEIEALEQEKERLLARMRAIEQLQTNRPLIVRLFDELVNSLPDGVSVTKVEQSGKQIIINGVAQSNARVSSFMRNLESSKWLDNPELDVIQAQTEQGLKVSDFTLRFQQVVPEAEAEEDQA